MRGNCGHGVIVVSFVLKNFMLKLIPHIVVTKKNHKIRNEDKDLNNFLCKSDFFIFSFFNILI